MLRKIELFFGAKHCGHPLPESLRQEMEQAFGCDFSAIRVHLGEQADALGAQAFCHGSDLYFAPDGFNPGSPQGRELIAHELAHVVQQRAGLLGGHTVDSVTLIGDAVLETEADSMARRAVLGERLPYLPQAAGFDWSVAQASLRCRERTFQSAEEAYQATLENVQGSFKTFFVHVKRDILPILNDWIQSRGGDDKFAIEQRRRLGQDRHHLMFDDYTNMARAVMGEFMGRIALEESENPLAEKTVNSPYIDKLLVSLLSRIHRKIAGEASNNALAVLLDRSKCPHGAYQPLYSKNDIRIADVLANPAGYGFSDKLVTLHDTMEYLNKQGKVSLPRDRSLGTYFRINNFGQPEYSRRPIEGTADFRFNDKDPQGRYQHYTLKENSGYVMAARVQGMPVWAGPSFTTGRMLMMAEWAGAPVEEIKALAWGIFAFWNRCYPGYATWVHRFHEVMDMAGNFGVYYWPFVYPKDIPPNDGQ